MTACTLRPLVYSCSGCSSVAQMANHLALRLDRDGLAEMSCIAGIGGDVKPLVQQARKAQAQGRAIVALDGCALRCCAACLEQRGLQPDLHVKLWEQGVRKHVGQDFDRAEADHVYAGLLAQVCAADAQVPHPQQPRPLAPAA